MSDAPAGDPGSGDIVEAVEQTEDVTTETPESQVEEPPRRYVEIDDPDDRYDRVKVNDEEIEVPYSEIKRGYSRTADYTRKTQELAQQRAEAEYGIRLQQALQANPQATIRYLAEQAGLQLGQQQAQPATEPEPEYQDPLEREIATERQARLALEQRIAQREMDEQVDRTIDGLRRQYNASDEDIQAVIATAMRGNYPVDALPMIYKSITLDKLQARAQAAQVAQQQREAETTRRQSSAAAATRVVSSGVATSSNGLTNRSALQERPTFREAALAAFEEYERNQQ